MRTRAKLQPTTNNLARAGHCADLVLHKLLGLDGNPRFVETIRNRLSDDGKMHFAFHEKYAQRERQVVGVYLFHTEAKLGIFLDETVTGFVHTIYDSARRNATCAFKRFRVDVTVLTPEIIEDIWMDVSAHCAAKVYQTWSSFSQTNDLASQTCDSTVLSIPSLESLITKGSIEPRFGDRWEDDHPRDEEYSAVRAAVMERIRYLDLNSEWFYHGMKDFIFDYWQNEFGLFSRNQ